MVRGTNERTSMFDTFTTTDNLADERALALLAGAHVGTPIAQVLRDMAGGGPPRRRIPTSALSRHQRRDMTAADAANGGYLVSVSQGPIEPLLRQYSIVAEGGVRLLSGLVGNLTIPKITAGAAVSWIPAEGDAVTATQPTLGQVALTPKYAGLLTYCSRQLLVQAQAEAIIESQIAGDIAAAVDVAVFQGTGNSGQPLGIVGTSGVYAQSGTSLGHAGLQNMLEKAVTGGARYSRLRWYGHPDAIEILATRERASGSGYCVEDGKIAGRPVISTSAVPTKTLVLGDPSLVLVAVFDGQGIGIERDDFSAFNTGLVGFRLLLAVDVAVMVPAAFSVATSIT
jgi:HK97 family phage major capsid protein